MRLKIGNNYEHPASTPNLLVLIKKSAIQVVILNLFCSKMVLQISLHFNSNLLKNSTAIEHSNYAKQSGGKKNHFTGNFHKIEKNVVGTQVWHMFDTG